MVKKVLTCILTLTFCTYIIYIPPAIAYEGRVLSDQELDEIHAGGLNLNFDALLGSAGTTAGQIAQGSVQNNQTTPSKDKIESSARVQILTPLTTVGPNTSTTQNNSTQNNSVNAENLTQAEIFNMAKEAMQEVAPEGDVDNILYEIMPEQAAAQNNSAANVLSPADINNANEAPLQVNNGSNLLATPQAPSEIATVPDLPTEQTSVIQTANSVPNNDLSNLQLDLQSDEVASAVGVPASLPTQEGAPQELAKLNDAATFDALNNLLGNPAAGSTNNVNQNSTSSVEPIQINHVIDSAPVASTQAANNTPTDTPVINTFTPTPEPVVETQPAQTQLIPVIQPAQQPVETTPQPTQPVQIVQEPVVQPVQQVVQQPVETTPQPTQITQIVQQPVQQAPDPTPQPTQTQPVQTVQPAQQPVETTPQPTQTVQVVQEPVQQPLQSNEAVAQNVQPSSNNTSQTAGLNAISSSPADVAQLASAATENNAAVDLLQNPSPAQQQAVNNNAATPIQLDILANNNGGLDLAINDPSSIANDLPTTDELINEVLNKVGNSGLNLAAAGRGLNAVNVSDSSQQNLSALVNVNAAGSIVPVLINLTVVVNSNISNFSALNNLDLRNFNSFQFR